jgi:hypothetical protein
MELAMDDPNHTANWLLEKVYNLFKSNPHDDAGEISLLLNVLGRFKSSLGTLYHENSYASEKITGATTMLLRVVGAEPASHSREDLLHFAAQDLTTLSQQNFILIR